MSALMVCVVNIQSQNIQFSFQELSEKDGLSQSSKYYLSTDSKGFVWIGSDNSLQRFDGKNLIKYQNDPNLPTSISENTITSKCIEDINGNLWFSSFNSLNCYIPKSNNFASYKLDVDAKDYNLFKSKDSLLFLKIESGSGRFLYYFDTQTKTFTKGVELSGSRCIPIENEENNVSHILSLSLIDGTGLDYIDITTGQKIHAEFKVNKKGTRKNFSYPTKTGLANKNGHAWVGLYNSIGKYKYGDTAGIIHEERNKTVDKDVGWINDIVAFKDDLLFVASDQGLLIFDIEEEKFVQQFKYSHKDNYPLSIKGISGINLDKSGNIWLSGMDQKVAFANIDKNRFPQLKVTSGISFINMKEDKSGNIWCSSIDSGTFVFNPEKKLLYHSKRLINTKHSQGSNPLPEIYYFLQSYNNRWWGNMGNYFFLWQDKSKEFQLEFSYFLGVANSDYNRINYCYTLSSGKNLIARGKEIYEVTLNETEVDTLPWFSLKPFDINIIKYIYEDQKGNIYISDDYGKLLIVRLNNNYLTLIETIPDFGTIHATQEDKKRNKIWIASTKGLGSFDINNLTIEKYEEQIARLNGEIIYDIVMDKIGQLWFPSSKGIIRLNPENNDLHCFTTADGLLSTVFSKNSSLMSSKTGEIWVGGKNGINVFNPEEIQLLSNKPSPQVIELLVNDEPFELENNITELEMLSLPFDQNTLSFQFAALDYADPTANEYYHQIVGLDEGPVSNKNRGFTRYGNIPAGNYIFKVWATNSDLILNENPLELAINISPPYYQTWWFYLLCLIAISGIIYGIFKYRIAQILKVERLRTRIASDLHDDVGGILSGLAMQSELLEMTAEEKNKNKLRQIADMSRSAMSGMRDTVWAIDSRKDKFEDLIDRIREHSEEVLIPKNIRYEIDIHEIPMATILSPLIRQNLYLIFKEAITNTAKHSNGNLVQIDLKKGKKHFEMRIHDNGVVDSKSYKTSGLGLSNIKMRAKNMGGHVSIDFEAGFEIILKTPLF